MGNIKKRKDLNQSTLEESFTYDNLYRLLSAQVNSPLSTLSLTYDALGNISSKSDVGNYTYHSTKKHQVVSTGAPTNWSFAYDANGNMTSGRGGESIDWTSYNYPSCIRMSTSCSGTSTDYSQFSYTPDRQYWKQVANFTVGGTATTTYVGGLLEKVATTAGTDYRHMIGIGNSTIIVSRQSGGTNSVNYVTSDHLGSSSAITNSSGAILLNSSFDAFGKRRGTNWTGGPSGANWTAIASLTRRGFTEHSMLDNLGLIHMNGRVDDPWLGRFLSADPFIPDPLDTQSFNRYSYVQNNPLSFVDPSGFWETQPWYRAPAVGDPPSSPVCTGAMGPPCEPWDRPEYDDPGTAQSSVSSGSIGQWSGDMLSFGGIGGYETVRKFEDIFLCDLKDCTEKQLTHIAWEYSGLKFFDCLFRAGDADACTTFEFSFETIGFFANAIPGLKAELGVGKEIVETANVFCCFAAGTPVWTETGPTPIEEIEIGDLVWSRDPETDEIALKPVEALIPGHERTIWVAKFEVADPEGDFTYSTFETTDNHPWAAVDGHWVATKDLQPGAQIRRAGGSPARVVSIEQTERRALTYNLDVADFHTYFVGESKIWVHNASKKCIKAAEEAWKALVNESSKATRGAGPIADIGKKIKQFSGKSLRDQKSVYENLRRTYQDHLKKYGQTAGQTSGETNRMERELDAMREILSGRGRTFGPNGELLD